MTAQECAIRREREVCAQIAEEYGQDYKLRCKELGLEYSKAITPELISKAIAQAIRGRNTPERGADR